MRILELDLQANDLAAQHQFYADVLGMSATPTQGALSVQAGSSKLVFRQAQLTEALKYHFAFNIPPDHFEEARAWISARVPIMKSRTGEDSFNFANWNAHAFYFLDPAGNILEFIARHDLTDDLASPFSAQSILCISEIGLASDDVKATVRFLQCEGLPVYDGEGSDTFTAVGDVHGLFIVIKRGRTWFPDSGTPAELLPLKVRASIAPGTTMTLSGPPYEFRYT